VRTRVHEFAEKSGTAKLRLGTLIAVRQVCGLPQGESQAISSQEIRCTTGAGAALLTSDGLLVGEHFTHAPGRDIKDEPANWHIR
jgi:hypothetical protein